MSWKIGTQRANTCGQIVNDQLANQNARFIQVMFKERKERDWRHFEIVFTNIKIVQHACPF